MIEEQDILQNNGRPFQESMPKNGKHIVAEPQKNTSSKKKWKFLLIGGVILTIIVFFILFRLIPIPLQHLSREEVFEKLTNNSWCTKTRGIEGFPEHTEYTFKSNGTYEEEYVTDVVGMPKEKKWNFEQDANGEWFLLYDDGTRMRFSLNSNGTLAFESAGNLKPCISGTNFDTGKQYNASTLPPIELSPSIKKKEKGKIL